MSKILENLRNVDPNDSDAVKETISAFFLNLLKHTELNCNSWLRALETVLTRYPRFCAQHRSTAETYLAHFLDSPNYYNVIEAAKCAHALQQIRPSQDKAATAKNCWREQLSILCGAAHKLIDNIFYKTVDIYKNQKDTKNLGAILLSNTPLTSALSNILQVKKVHSANKNTLLGNRLRNVFVFIQAMLVEIYPVAKPIQPQSILEVILRAISVSSSVNTNVTEAVSVKIQALKTLDAMIACLGPNLIPFSSLVFKCMMQTLRWTTDNPSEESRKVRCASYSSLTRWLCTLNVHRVASDARGRAWEDELTNVIISDVTPPKKLVQLTMSNQYTKNLSKKARKKLANTMLQQSTIANHMPGEKNKNDVSEETNDEIAITALECAETFITVCGIFLKPTTHKVFQERLVRECYNLDSYTTERCIHLLRALEACRKNTPVNVPPPTQYALQLYSTLVNSQCDEIKKIASLALLDIRLHLHCSPPSLSFAIEAQPEKKRSEDKRKRLSEKNRAALQSLLGKDRMPQPSEVITIADEPSNKKARLNTEESDVIADNISLSSESANSIEICDDEADDDIVLQIEPESPVHVDKEPETNIEESVIDQDVNNSPIMTIDIVDSGISAQNPDEPAQTVQESEPTSSVESAEVNIFEAKTQIPVNTCIDTEGVKSPVSMEVVYDPNLEKSVTVLEKMDDENLPSTNDTDDVQITCGQTIRSSQDYDEKSKVEGSPKVNGFDKPDTTVNEKNGVVENIEVKITTKEISVDDMLADFVDEVNEEGKTPA